MRIRWRSALLFSMLTLAACCAVAQARPRGAQGKDENGARSLRTDFSSEETQRFEKVKISLGAELLKILEKRHGAKHPRVAEILRSLAISNYKCNNYAEAKQLAVRALAIDEKAYGHRSALVAEDLDIRAAVQLRLGEFGSAKLALERCLRIFSKIHGPDSTDVALTYSRLGSLYFALNDTVRAKEMFDRSVKAYLGAVVIEPIDFATSLANLAMAQAALHDFVAAKETFRQALGIFEQYADADDPVFAGVLEGYGALHMALGDALAAKLALEQALSIQEKVLGRNHFEVAVTLANLATAYSGLGDEGVAQDLFARSLSIMEAAFKEDNPATASTLLNLAASLARCGRVQEAFGLMVKAQSIDQSLVEQVMGFTTDEQKLLFLADRKAGLDLMLVFALALRDDRQAVQTAFDIWLRRKGAALEAQREAQEALVLSGGREAQRLFAELSRLRVESSRLAFALAPEKRPAENRQRLAELRTRQEELEAGISKLSLAYSRERTRAVTDTKQVASALPQGTVLIELAKVHNAGSSLAGGAGQAIFERYLAFILPARHAERLTLVDLGDAKEIDEAVTSLKEGIKSGKTTEKSRDAARRLHQLVFEPLSAGLGDAKEILLSPDGDLSLVPFEILLGKDMRPLIEDYTFNYLTAGRDIIGMNIVPPATGPSIVIGAPAFNYTPKRGGKLRRNAEDETGQGRPPLRSTQMRDIHFGVLSSARDEAVAVKHLLGNGAQLFLGKAAVEAVLHTPLPPRYLHLATHGFFLKDQDIENIRESRQFSYADLLSPKPRPLKAVDVENPLRRSGVALAGANIAIRDGGSEGLVTAEKFLSLRLTGTELVTLSACQSGQGEVKTGEGVFGLRRAITQAGAKGLVMSMWSVPDKETKELMVTFYGNLQQGMGKAQALRQAILAERKVVKERYGNDDFSLWGAFVYLGER